MGSVVPPDHEPDHGDAPRKVLPYPLKYLGGARQVVIVASRSWSSTQARLEAYEQGLHGWHSVLGPVAARIGRTGMIAADRRIQGSDTTPAGTFALTEAFGLAPDPGTRLPYTQVTSPDHWWVCDPVSPHYNTLRLGTQGGFRTVTGGRRGSERITDRSLEYEHVVVVDFNRPAPNRKQGSGIFVRVSSGLPTDGGVGVPAETVVELLRWLDPVLHPVITLAPERSIMEF